MTPPLSALPLVDLLEVLAEKGECRYDPELHTGPDAFESETLAERRARVAAAKEVCESCPVWEACLEYALRHAPSHGVWAGYTARELSDLRSYARTVGEVA